MKDKNVFKPAVPYKHLSEAEVAYKYFDWQFYLGRRKLSLETMTEEEILNALTLPPFGFSRKTLYEMELEKKYNYAKQKDYENLTEGR